jgi:hypothetical protein
VRVRHVRARTHYRTHHWPKSRRIFTFQRTRKEDLLMGNVHSICRRCEAHDDDDAVRPIAQRPLRTVETPMQSSIPLLPVRVASSRSAREAGCCRAPCPAGERVAAAHGTARGDCCVVAGAYRQARRGVRERFAFISALGSLPASTHVASLAPRGSRGSPASSVLEGQAQGQMLRAHAHGVGPWIWPAWYGIPAPRGTAPTPAGKQRVPNPCLFCDGSRQTAPSRANAPAERRWGGVGVVVYRWRPATPCINDARPGPASSRGRWNCLRSDGHRAKDASTARSGAGTQGDLSKHGGGRFGPRAAWRDAPTRRGWDRGGRRAPPSGTLSRQRPRQSHPSAPLEPLRSTPPDRSKARALRVVQGQKRAIGGNLRGC